MTNMQEEYSKEHIEARAIAIKHIGISTYSSGKIYNYLINKGVSESIAHDVVEELIKRDYINDYRASRIILLQRNGYHQESKYYLYNRLLQGGVNEAIADSYINELDDEIIKQSKRTAKRPVNNYAFCYFGFRFSILCTAQREGLKKKVRTGQTVERGHPPNRVWGIYL